jgi:hypothetical protein
MSRRFQTAIFRPSFGQILYKNATLMGSHMHITQERTNKIEVTTQIKNDSDIKTYTR